MKLLHLGGAGGVAGEFLLCRSERPVKRDDQRVGAEHDGHGGRGVACARFLLSRSRFGKFTSHCGSEA